jgi:hypothetical protein
MSFTSTNICVIDQILVNDGKEILNDELFSPVFSNLIENEVSVPKFVSRGKHVSNKTIYQRHHGELMKLLHKRRGSVWSCSWLRCFRGCSGSQSY